MYEIRVANIHRLGAARPVLFQIAMLAIYVALLAALHFPQWPYVAAFLCILALARSQRMETLSILNILFWIFAAGLMKVSLPEFNTGMSPWPVVRYGGRLVPAPPALGIALSVAVVAAFAGIYFLLFEIHRRFPRLRTPLGWCLLSYVAIEALTRIRIHTLWGAFVVGVFYSFSKAFWMIAYQLSETDFLSRRPFWAHLGTLNSPWQTTWVNTTAVRGYSDYLNNVATSNEELAASQVSGIRLAVHAGLLFLAAKALDLLFFEADGSFYGMQTHGLPYLVPEFSTAGFVARRLPRALAWLFILSRTFHFLLMFAVISHTMVSVARMCGFRVRRNVYKPHQATSFNSFLGRVYYYYIAILQRFFFYPLWSRTRMISSKKARIFIVHFLTILVGGLIYNFERFAVKQTAGPFPGIWECTAHRLTYFVGLGLVCGITAILPEPPAWLQARAGRYLRVAVYFTLYALCYATQFQPADGIGDFDGARGVLFLFGLA